MIRVKDVDTVIYYTVNGNRIHGIGYAGRALRPTFNYSFRSSEQFAKYIKEFRDGRLKTLAFKAEMQAKRKAFVHSLAVGDVLRSSWGYDQTNVDFYEVTKVIGKQVEIRSIGKEYKETGFMCGQSIPAPGKFTGDAFRCLVGQGNSVKVSSCAHASKIEPKTLGGAKVYDSSYESHYA